MGEEASRQTKALDTALLSDRRRLSRRSSAHLGYAPGHDEAWLKVIRGPDYAPRQPGQASLRQASLFL